MTSLSVADIIILIGILGAGFYWYLTSTFNYWKKRNVIYDKPYPLVGTFGSQLLMKKHINLSLQDTYNKHPNEHVVGGFMSRTPTLIVRDPDIIKQIIVKDFNHFRDRGINPDTKLEPLTQHLFLLSGDKWKMLRQKLTPTFTSGKMRNAFPILAECGKEFQNYLHYVMKEGQEPEIKDLMAKYTTDVIGTYAFGLKMNSMKDENSPFRVMGRKMFKPNIIRGLKLALFRLFPFLFQLFRLRLFPITIENFFLSLFKSVVQSRDNKPSTRHDFIDLLIELKSKGYVKSDNPLSADTHINESENIKITDELLAAQAFIFFGAGFETSSTAMSFALYELAKNKPVQEKLTAEIDQILSKYNGKLTYDALKEMSYLRMVINESLRKYPPAGLLARMCTKPYKIPNTEITLNEGVLVNIPIYAIQNDPKYFPEPEKFIPERFSAEEIETRHPFVFLPFGDGPRNCIANRFARIQTMLGLVSVLELYNVEASSKTVPKINFVTSGFITASDKGIYLKLRRRKP